MNPLELDLAGRERRLHRRLPYVRSLRVEPEHDGAEMIVRGVDISRGGMRFRTRSALAVGERGIVTLARKDGTFSRVPFVVVHQEDIGPVTRVCGVRFIRPA